jgi:hypothetical protein
MLEKGSSVHKLKDGLVQRHCNVGDEEESGRVACIYILGKYK